MKEKIQNLLEAIERFSADTKEHVEEFRIKLLSKKGKISELFEEFKNVSPEIKREVGVKLNELKNKAVEKLNQLKEKFEAVETSDEKQDLTLPASTISLGSRHPISIVRNNIVEIFSRIGFTTAEGPEVEDDWHNFTALNTPEFHPARDMQDTFYVQTKPSELVLRTHTSSVQIRTMETEKPPIRKIFPGRVYRNEAVSARAHCFFHQVEGLYIDEHVSFADMKQTLIYFAKEMFGNVSEVRLRPSYFPFTEPSAEMDVSCFICDGKGCSVCKQSGWVEIIGCGMVHPVVFENCKIDSAKFTGFAFGMGIERIAMLKFRISDLRLFSENDVRFLNQFKSVL